MAEALTAKDVVQALWDTYSGRFAMLTEVPVFGHKEGFVDTEDWRARASQPWARYIDVLLIAPGSAKPVPYERIAVEIKVSRSDFRADTAEKRGWWQRSAHRFAYCVPKGLVTPDEVPEGCGLLIVSEPGYQGRRSVEWIKRSPRRTEQPEPFSAYLTHYIASRAARAEAQAKGYSWAARQQESDPDVLRVQRDEARKAQQAAETRAEKEREKREDAVRLLRQIEPQVCADCGRPIEPTYTRSRIKRDHYGWRHADRADDEPCAAIYREHALAEATAQRDERNRRAAADGWRHRETGPPYIPTQVIVPR